MALKHDEVISQITAWLRFQKQMGLEFLPNTDKVKIFLNDQHDLAKNNMFDLSNVSNLEELKEKVINCTGCNLAQQRHNVVFGEGPSNATLMVVGEAPGREEDLTGRPFVGPSGELLTKMLKAIDIDREEVFITSVVKCRPPKNRTPRAEEIKSCKPILKAQIELIKPKLILALGTVAAHTLLKTQERITNLRNKLHHLDGIKVVVTYHPAYILRFGGIKQKNLKKEAWEDLLLLQKEYRKLAKTR